MHKLMKNKYYDTWIWKVLRTFKKKLVRCAEYVYYSFKWHGKLIFPYSATIYGESSFEGANKLCNGVRFKGSMGYGSYIGENSQLTANIGRFTSIAPEVINNPGKHPITTPYVSTSPMFFSIAKQNGYTFADKQCFEEFKGYLSIGNDCWIGQRAFLVGGITIADGAVVLGGAFVTKDVPPYAIVGGVPAKVLGYRYDEETIAFLLKIQWWNNSIEWFEENWRLMNDINKLKLYYENR